MVHSIPNCIIVQSSIFFQGTCTTVFATLIQANIHAKYTCNIDNAAVRHINVTYLFSYLLFSAKYIFH